MKANLTEIIFILDKSGSMYGLEKDTIGGFNSMLKKQKKEKGDAYVSVLLFNQECEVVYDRVSIKTIKNMTGKDYQVGGSTALLDTVGAAIMHIMKIHNGCRSEDVPEHTLFIIITDGLENSSRNYNYEQVKELIEGQKRRGWEFLFIGANIDAVSVASKVGISAERTANYRSDHTGTTTLWENISAPISEIRNNVQMTRTWADNIEKDNQNRK